MFELAPAFLACPASLVCLVRTCLVYLSVLCLFHQYGHVLNQLPEMEVNNVIEESVSRYVTETIAIRGLIPIMI